MTYALANSKEYEDLCTATSHLTGHKINRFTHIHQNIDDLFVHVVEKREDGVVIKGASEE